MINSCFYKMRKGNFAEDKAKEYLAKAQDYHSKVSELMSDIMLEQNLKQILGIVYDEAGVASGVSMFSAYFANLVHSRRRSIDNPLELGPACRTFNIAEIDRVFDLEKGELSEDNVSVTFVPFKIPYLPRRPSNFGWNVFQSSLNIPLDRWLGKNKRCAHFCYFSVVENTFYLTTPDELTSNEIKTLQVMKMSDEDTLKVVRTMRKTKKSGRK